MGSYTALPGQFPSSFSLSTSSLRGLALFTNAIFPSEYTEMGIARVRAQYVTCLGRPKIKAQLFVSSKFFIDDTETLRTPLFTFTSISVLGVSNWCSSS